LILRVEEKGGLIVKGVSKMELGSGEEAFHCLICLEVAYKPIVHACGHLFCFWCVHLAMNGSSKSRCPLCRRPYMYFPRICEQLHRFLWKVVKDEYFVRAKEVWEEELQNKRFSPQFEEDTFFLKVCNGEHSSMQNFGNGICTKEEASKDKEAYSTMVPNVPTLSIEAANNRTLNSEAAEGELFTSIAPDFGTGVNHFQVPSAHSENQNALLGSEVKVSADVQCPQNKHGGFTSNGCENMANCSSMCPVTVSRIQTEPTIMGFLKSPQDSLGKAKGPASDLSPTKDSELAVEERVAERHVEEQADARASNTDIVTAMAYLQCSVCKNLLYRPITLNCGHMFCQSCVPGSKKSKEFPLLCPLCKSHHPGLFPQVCLELHHYLESVFPSIYSERAFQTRCDSEKPRKGIEALESVPEADSQNRKELRIFRPIHDGYGCDGCGMMPIVGKRFHCTDCPDAIGYDLCGKCHQSGCVVGRFNQQHKPEHKMDQVRHAGQMHTDLARQFLDILVAGHDRAAVGIGNGVGSIVDTQQSAGIELTTSDTTSTLHQENSSEIEEIVTSSFTYFMPTDILQTVVSAENLQEGSSSPMSDDTDGGDLNQQFWMTSDDVEE
jgi:hypothetical protein